MARRRITTEPSGYTILVVDDQEETLISNRMLLEREGHRVLTAVNGEEALTLFSPGQVHLVIVDYFMPRMSGEELVREIRTRDEDVQILLQTGYAGEKPPREMLQLLAIQGYHDKTDGPDRLLIWVDVTLKAAAQLERIRATEREIEESRSQLRHLSTRLLRVQEEEREHISRELHDHLGQLLTALGMDVEWALHHCPGNLSSLRERLQEANQLVQRTIQAVRELSATLRPGALQELGLEIALRGYTADFARRSGLALHFSSAMKEEPVSPEIAVNAYRIVQEALTNVARHAAATSVRVELGRAPHGLFVSVVDNGRGFEISRVSDPHAVGLVGMRERARLIGGRVEIRSTPGMGTTVRLDIPLPEEQ
jgi:signal transduction histidine kinase